MLTWIGVSWRTASSARRAGLVALDQPGALAIHTCARDAWLVEGDGAELRARLRGFDPERFEGTEAVERLFAVACGLDSAVQGEADVGRQVRAALASSELDGAPALDHVLARLLRQARREGWVREGHGVAALAAREVRDAPTVGFVGAGALGSQLVRLLGPRAALYNRSEREGARPLSAMAPASAWIVATAAPTPWFRPPGPYDRLVDLGHPAQAFDDVRRISLDDLLTGANARLDPALVLHAQTATRAATSDALTRLGRREPLAAGACA